MSFLKGKVNGSNAQSPSRSIEQGERLLFPFPWRCTWNDQSVGMSPPSSNEFGEAFCLPPTQRSHHLLSIQNNPLWLLLHLLLLTQAELNDIKSPFPPGSFSKQFKRCMRSLRRRASAQPHHSPLIFGPLSGLVTQALIETYSTPRLPKAVFLDLTDELAWLWKQGIFTYIKPVSWLHDSIVLYIYIHFVVSGLLIHLRSHLDLSIYCTLPWI